MAWRIPGWTWRIALGVVGAGVAVVIVLGWFHANQIRSEFLLPRPAQEGYDLEVISSEAGRVVLSRTESSEASGFWGLEGASSYGQVSTIVRVTEDTVERGIRTLEGEFSTGEPARMDADAYTGDPFEAHRIGYEELVTPSEIGPHNGWFIDGRRPTWIMFVHGRGNDRLTESLRIIPSLVEQGFPVMVVSYRNDVGATPSESGMRTWGLEEWRDIEAAVELGERKGARDFVIVGSGFGASIVSTFLHESDQIGIVRGVIYDTPVLDLEGVVERWAGDIGTPRIVSWLGRKLTEIRFGIEWSTLDQLDRVEEFDVPMLILTGGDDPVSDPAATQEFAARLGELATFSRFEQAGHTDLWNIDQSRYEATIDAWLFELLGPE